MHRHGSFNRDALKVCDGKSGSLLVEDKEEGEGSHMRPVHLLRKLMEKGVFPQSYNDSANGNSETPFYYAFTRYLKACTGWIDYDFMPL